jgi:hypothetical protein
MCKKVIIQIALSVIAPVALKVWKFFLLPNFGREEVNGNLEVIWSM